jgi:threonine/homoserine/homoserine lactone efflux protein
MEVAGRAPLAFAVLKWASVVYILWLAWRIAGSRISTATQTKAPGFFAGLIVHPLNPKAWAMITVGFTSFVAEGTPTFTATAVIALSLMSVQLLLHPLWTLGGQAIAERMAGQKSEKYLMWVLAGLTVASVLLVLMKEG